jgi:hypothetical protein
MSWTGQELATVEKIDEVNLASQRADGTLGKPVVVWAVRVGEEVYVRAVAGPGGAWFRGTRESGLGHFQMGAVDREVKFLDGAGAPAEAIDAAYRRKYRRYPSSYVDSVTSPRAQEATLRVEPR